MPHGWTLDSNLWRLLPIFWFLSFFGFYLSLFKTHFRGGSPISVGSSAADGRQNLPTLCHTTGLWTLTWRLLLGFCIYVLVNPLRSKITSEEGLVLEFETSAGENQPRDWGLSDYVPRNSFRQSVTCEYNFFFNGQISLLLSRSKSFVFKITLSRRL